MHNLSPPEKRFLWLRHAMHQKILGVLNAESGEGRFVGSAVRDSLLGEMPGDFDIATTHEPETVMRLCAKEGFAVYPTGLAYGTVTVRLQNNRYEITTLRQDLSSNGRHAQVAFTKEWQEDACRRDFTINALYLDAQGKLYDWHHGIHDLQKGSVRFIGDPTERVEEDYLRILRFFRFQARYGDKALHQPSLNACLQQKQNLSVLSSARILKEVEKILLGPGFQTIQSIWSAHNFWGILGDTQACAASLSSLIALEESLSKKAPWPVHLYLIYPQDPPRFLRNRLQRKLWQHQGIEKIFADEKARMVRNLRLFAWERRMANPTFCLWIALTVWLKNGRITLHQTAELFRFLESTDLLLYKLFPLSGDDLKVFHFSSAQLFGQTLKTLQKEWIIADGCISKKLLMERAKRLSVQ